MSRVLDISDGFTSNSEPSINLTSWEIVAAQAIASGGTISLGSDDSQILKVSGSGGAQTASTTPFGVTPPNDGTMIRVHGQNDTNTLELVHNDAADGCILNGNAILGLNDVIELRYDQTDDRYIEQSRNF